MVLYQGVQQGNISCTLTPVAIKCYFSGIWRSNPKQSMLVLNLTNCFFAVPEGVYCKGLLKFKILVNILVLSMKGKQIKSWRPYSLETNYYIVKMFFTINWF